jgi:predicted AAA+ superfamily ATPase
MEEPGQLLEISELAGELNISRQTLSNYLSYLEQSFLLRKLYNYSTGRSKVERKLRKYYPAIISVDLLFRDDDLAKSRVLEWAVIGQLKAEYFWRDPYKNEVDAILIDTKPVPIEIKYGRLDTAGLEAFMREFKINKGYVLSSSKEETRKAGKKTIAVVPAYKFLLTNSRATKT